MTISNYKDSYLDSLTHILSQQATQVKLEGTGVESRRTTSTLYTEAGGYRYNSGTIFDLYSPQISFSSNSAIYQSKSIGFQTSQMHTTALSSWLDVSLGVGSYENYFIHSKDRGYFAAKNFFLQSEKSLTYADECILQIGQEEPLSEETEGGSVEPPERGPNYGRLSLGAINNFLLESKLGNFLVNAGKNIFLKASGFLKLSAEEGFSLSATGMGKVSATGELMVSSTGLLSLSSKGMLTLSTMGVMYVDASVIYVGPQVGAKPSVDLDIVGIAQDISLDTISDISSFAFSALSGDFGGAVFDLANILPIGLDGALSSVSEALGGVGEGLESITSSIFDQPIIGDLFNTYLGKYLSPEELLKDIPGADALKALLNPPFIQMDSFTFRKFPDIENVSLPLIAAPPKGLPTYTDSITTQLRFPTSPPLKKEDSDNV